MPKNKKTKAQKILSDKRREMTHTPLYSLPQNISTDQPKQPVARPVNTATISTSSYKYLGADLRKTFLVTLLIIIAEVLIHYFAKGV